MDGDTKLCLNCKKEISANNFVMHEMHCRRHIVLCENCGEPIPRSELDQHFNDVHAKVPCERCQLQIPRSEIENHMDRDCSKKPETCEFCELSFPRDEYDGHIGYCGSRTECCPLCHQYIMLKDRDVHEGSGCMYPEPKPAPSQPPPGQGSDPFNMADLQDFLEVDSQLGRTDDMPDFTANLRRELQRLDQVGSHPTRSRHSRNVLVDRDSLRGVPSDRNNGALTDTWEAIPPDMDYDTMLALQLAHDDWAEDTNGGVRDRQLPPRMAPADDTLTTDFPAFTTSNVDSRLRGDQEFTVEDDDLTIPCEFCFMELPMSIYLDHVDSCPLSETVTGNEVNYADRNNQMPVSNAGVQRSSIPVINNLRSDRQRGHRDSPHSHIDETGSSVDDAILPCEFCEDMFPAEVIVQHQSVCPANGFGTPRAITPASGPGASRTGQHMSSVSGSRDNTSSQATKQWSQADTDRSAFDFPPVSNFGNDDDDDDDGPRSNFFRDASYVDSLQSTSDKYTPSVNRFDDSITRPPRRSSRQLSQEDYPESSRSPVVNQPPPRSSKSAQRTRASLNQLLQENTGAGATSQNRPPQRKIAQRGRTAGDSYSTSERRPPPRASHVNSRTVLRELDRAQPTSSSRGTSRRTHVSNSNTNQASAPAEGARGSHQGQGQSRQSRNQIFSPELRLKPDHNPPRRTR